MDSALVIIDLISRDPMRSAGFRMACIFVHVQELDELRERTNPPWTHGVCVWSWLQEKDCAMFRIYTCPRITLSLPSSCLSRDFSLPSRLFLSSRDYSRDGRLDDVQIEWPLSKQFPLQIVSNDLSNSPSIYPTIRFKVHLSGSINYVHNRRSYLPLCVNTLTHSGRPSSYL